MESSLIGLLSEVMESAKKPHERAITIKRATESIKRLSSEALSCEAMLRSEMARSDDFLAHGQDAEYALSQERVRKIHTERCSLVHQVATLARSITLEVLGTLAIDATTAGTGLDEADRSVIAAVSGRDTRW